MGSLGWEVHAQARDFILLTEGTSFPLMGFFVAMSTLYKHHAYNNQENTTQKHLARKIPHWSPASVTRMQKEAKWMCHDPGAGRVCRWSRGQKGRGGCSPAFPRTGLSDRNIVVLDMGQPSNQKFVTSSVRAALPVFPALTSGPQMSLHQ